MNTNFIISCHQYPYYTWLMNHNLIFKKNLENQVHLFHNKFVLLPFTKPDPIVNRLWDFGEQTETLNRICHELPGYNWLEKKIRKSSTTSPNDIPIISQASSSTTSTTTTITEDKSEGGDFDDPLPSKASGNLSEKLRIQGTKNLFLYKWVLFFSNAIKSICI